MDGVGAWPASASSSPGSGASPDVGAVDRSLPSPAPTVGADQSARVATASASPEPAPEPQPGAVAGGTVAATAAAATPTVAPSDSPAATATPGPSMRSGPDSGVVADSDWVVTNTERLPACGTGDVTTPLHSLSDWKLTLVDSTLSVPSDYVPDDLVSTVSAGLSNYFTIRQVAIDDLTKMAAAASAADASLGIASSYRDYTTQHWTFWYWVSILGYDRALLSSARPGHSEHQLGVAIDFSTHGGPDPWTYRDFATETRAGEWLFANAWKYGFIMSYPKGKTAKTCYAYEPWHYRYVGVAEAAAVRASGLTLREWLWQHQPNPESLSPMSTPLPTPISMPSAAPSPTPSPSVRRSP